MAFQDFDLISQRRKLERQQKLKKRIMIAVVTSLVILLVAAAVCVVVYKDHEDKEDAKPSKPSQAKKKATPSAPDTETAPKTETTLATAEKAVKTICSGTDYKQTCETSLMKVVKKNSSATQPKDLLKAAITVASDEILNVKKNLSSITFDTPFKKAAFNDCLVLLNDAVDELNSTVSTLEAKDLGKLSSRSHDINNWLSAVMSYQQTCVDGFPEGEVKTEVEKMLKTGKVLTSNSLAIVGQLSSILTAFQNYDAKRNLLSMAMDEDGLPTWMDAEDRRMLKADAPKQTPNATVAKDGSGNFTTVNAALKAMPSEYKGRYVIYVKEGIYDENVIITKDMVNVTIYGDGSQKSVITGNKNYVDGVPTFQTATFAALGEGFMAQSIGFRNTAGPEKHQAVALRVQSDRSIFLNCRMEGYQDTLYAQTHRQYYRSCYITGTVDFIFGDAAAVFQNCMIYVRKPMENQQNIVTAQGRVDKRETTGIVLQNCRILPDDKLAPEKAKFKSYLGRPWKEYSRTIVMESEIEDFIDPTGWMEWSGNFALKTLFYAEYNNKGPGSDVSKRVTWPGYKKITREEASKFTVGPFLQGESWVKGVPVRLGLMN